MGKKVVSILIGVLLTAGIMYPACSSAQMASGAKGQMPEGDWREHKRAHFIVYYHPGISENYVRAFAGKCENYYRSITHRLGFERFNFWLWDNRAKIFLYRTKEDYLGSTGRAAWSGASVNIKKKWISTFYFESDFFDVILPHELSHIILREFIGLETKTPLWFDEGTACANEEDSLKRYFFTAKKLVEKGYYNSVAQISGISTAESATPSVFYPVSAAVVIYLLEIYGRGRFEMFCRNLRDGEPFTLSLGKIYRIRGTEDLNKKLLSYLDSKSYLEIRTGKGFKNKW
ncbi:MAG: hypothetical protein ABH844_03775 [Candidatus Omnitrophota bacterium]